MLKTLINLFPLFFLLTACHQESVKKTTNSIEPPNVIIIFTDDQGYGDVGVYGASDIETPNLVKWRKMEFG